MQLNKFINSKWSFSGSYDSSNLTFHLGLFFNKFFCIRLFVFLKLIFTLINFHFTQNSLKKEDFNTYNTNLGKLLTNSLIKLGPSFIKFGQFLSVRSDFLCREIINELKTLQDSLPSQPFADCQEAFRHDFNVEINEIFKSFDPKPFASASIAQVHKAYLKDSNSPIAVKIQRPYLPGQFYIDLLLIKNSLIIYDKFIKRINLSYFFALLDEFGITAFDELNFIQEAKNANEIKQNLKHLNFVKIPKINWSFTGRHVITMEYLESAKISSLRTKKHIDSFIIKTFNCYLQQFLIYGLFHGDPHESNIGCSKDLELVIYDFGIVGRIDNETRNLIIKFILAIFNKNIENATQIIQNLGIVQDNNSLSLVRKILNILILAKEQDSFKHNDINKVFRLIKELDNKWYIPPKLFLLFKTAYYLSGFLLNLNESINIEFIIFEVVKELVPVLN